MGLRVDDGSIDTAELDTSNTSKLFVACYRESEKPAHVVDHASCFRRICEFYGRGKLVELRSFEKLMVVVKGGAQRFLVIHLNFAT